ncbi:hypothetical protein RHMOL_Rhmol04G0334900 [Rhododendron molle]|uniref:Uncharacterized protein n=1 Tax=Rhododendron molle TaxID=49168 RepID=A0ACC0P798_RHOML|nr:hypothetical protein RHMOL_Rhmol04G0334900 [Rhododendron molle]
MSSIMPLFIWRVQWREPSVVNDYMGSLDGGAYQEKYQHIPVHSWSEQVSKAKENDQFVVI